ncbi:MAG: hypothetical protein H7X94_13495, partial [Vallitaleaceae bacterium]|nr:hypothetical protein [Vallitaleaceae bacterium]
VSIPNNFDFSFSKNSFKKGDMIPENYFDCRRTTGAPPITTTFTKPMDQTMYQVSYNQEITVNTMGHQIFSADLVRDFEEIINAVKSVPTDGSIQGSLQSDLLGDYFDGMMTKIDKHIDAFVKEESTVGSKINRLELTINRLNDDKVNFTDLMSENEDVDMTEAIISLKAQEVVYNASLASSSMLMQKSLMDFLR